MGLCDEASRYRLDIAGVQEVRKWFGHVSWMGQERLFKALSQWRPENAKRRRGRCRTRWKDAVERDVRQAGLDQDLEPMASDKAQWRDMLALLVP